MPYMSATFGVPPKAGALALLGMLLIVPRALLADTEEVAPVPADEQSFIEYQLRPNEDPSKVAHMFHVPLEDLLALNHVADARRLAAGSTLRIPDPRAALVKRLSTEKTGVERQLAGAQAEVTALKNSLGQLHAELADLRAANEEMRGEQTLYRVWRTAVFVSGGIAAALALGLLLIWAKAREAERHNAILLKEAEVMHTAFEKYRLLGGQFELKYQSLFHQVGLPPAVQHRAHALRAAYEEDRAHLDAVVADAEREIKDALAGLSNKRESAHAAVRLAAVTAARKGG